MLLLLSVTTTPLLPAGSAKVTVPVDDVPPVTVDGLKASPLGVDSVTANAAFCVELL